jgi:tRNA threonylcarbamoyladenosine biosynthesis protein TsaB
MRKIGKWSDQFGTEIALRQGIFVQGYSRVTKEVWVWICQMGGSAGQVLWFDGVSRGGTNGESTWREGRELITLGIDTCEARGSVAVRKDGMLVSVQKHESAEDYSSWLLPAVESGMVSAGARLRDIQLLAVACGPGSFTGVRVGLTAVKAWAELFGIKVVGVSRLEVMARQVEDAPGFVAASFDAQRGQVFGGLYWREGKFGWNIVEEEMVIAPAGFVDWVEEQVNAESVQWISLDPKLFADLPGWGGRAAIGERMILSTDALAAGVAELGEERAREGKFTDPLVLDANYVRRSDAEIFWKDPASHGK